MPSPQKVVAVVYERFQLDGFGLLHDSFLPQRSSFIPDSGLWSTVADASSAVRNIGKNSWNDGGDATPLPSWLLHPASNPPPPPPQPQPFTSGDFKSKKAHGQVSFKQIKIR